MALTDVRVLPPNRRCAAVEYGTTAVSSLLAVPDDDPVDCRTPTTCNGTPFRVTVWSIGERAPNSCCAVVGPSTTTPAALFSSAAVRNRPLSILRARTLAQGGVVPTTLVVQFVDPTASVPDDVVAGATCATSGAATLDA